MAGSLGMGLMRMVGQIRVLVGSSGAGGLLAVGCGSGRDPNSDVLKLGAYSVVKEVLGEGLLPAFADEWKKKTGRSVRFEESYNGSGAQTRAILGI